MIYRTLDVVFQYLKPLVAVCLVVPLAVGGMTFALKHSEIISARLWADRPVFTPDFASDRFTSYDTPADIEATLMQEVITTDTFGDMVLAKVEAQYESWPPAQQEQALADLRGRVTVTTSGSHLFLVNYTTRRPDYGIRVVAAIIDSFSTTVQELEASAVGVAENTLQMQLDAARDAMNKAIADAQNYQASRHLSDQAAQDDPNYGTLLAQARLATDRYLSLLARVDQAEASRMAVVNLQASLFHVVDPPMALPQKLSRSTPGVSEGLAAIGAIAGIEALLVYVVARRDPTVRSGEDVRRAVGLKPLGSVPILSFR